MPGTYEWWRAPTVRRIQRTELDDTGVARLRPGARRPLIPGLQVGYTTNIQPMS